MIEYKNIYDISVLLGRESINMTQAISKSKDTLLLLFKRPAEKIVQLIQQIYTNFCFTVCRQVFKVGRQAVTELNPKF